MCTVTDNVVQSSKTSRDPETQSMNEQSALSLLGYKQGQE